MSDKETTRLAAAIQRGENAGVVLRQLIPVIEALQDRYYQAVVNNSRDAGKVDEWTVKRMVVLDDLIQELKIPIGRGERASAKLEKQRLTKQAGGGDI